MPTLQLDTVALRIARVHNGQFPPVGERGGDRLSHSASARAENVLKDRLHVVRLKRKMRKAGAVDLAGALFIGQVILKDFKRRVLAAVSGQQKMLPCNMGVLQSRQPVQPGSPRRSRVSPMLLQPSTDL